MAVERSVWKRNIDESYQNAYPCPRCKKGNVRRGDNQIVLVEPHHSAREHAYDDWDPEWIEMSFTAILICDNVACGESVAVSGKASVSEGYDYDDDGYPQDRKYETWLKPVSMFPAPPIFPISKKIPDKVADELKLAFQLYWTDLSASTSRLRTSLERVLDEEGIPTSEKAASGKLHRYNLFERIGIFEKDNLNKDIAESMTALRIVGNLGAHGDEVTEGDYFDLLDVYEDALAEIYEQKTATLKSKKQALIALKR